MVSTKKKQTINQSTNQQIIKSTNQPINQSTNQPINQSTNQQIKKRVAPLFLCFVSASEHVDDLMLV
jgi:hypothetical protein